MNMNKDSREVVQFLAAFAELRNLIDDEPNGLYKMAIDDDDRPLRKLCEKVYWAAFSITCVNKQRRELFASPVDPNFIKVWNDYEKRYQDVVDRIANQRIRAIINEALKDLSFPKMSNAKRDRSQLEIEWENADDEAGEKVDQLKVALEFASEELDFEDSVRDVAHTEQLAESLDGWKKLAYETGLDLRGVFRRRALVPFTLIPRHVALKEVDKASLSPIDLLQQAQEAFIFGTSYAALALMRAVMETVLRDHYQARGKDLCEKVNNCKMSSQLMKQAMHILRMRGNEVLHKKSSNLPKAFGDMNNQEQELEVVRLLFQLRELVQEAPAVSKRGLW